MDVKEVSCRISSSGLDVLLQWFSGRGLYDYMFSCAVPVARCMHFASLCCTGMDASPPQDVSIIDKDESSDKAYHVVDGYVIEDSKTPFPVGVVNWGMGVVMG